MTIFSDMKYDVRLRRIHEDCLSDQRYRMAVEAYQEMVEVLGEDSHAAEEIYFTKILPFLEEEHQARVEASDFERTYMTKGNNDVSAL